MSVEDAVADLDRTERDLDHAVASLAGLKQAESAQQQPRPAASATPTQQPSGTGQSRVGTDFEGGDPCFTACRALASMRRSVDHLCGLTGDADARCEGARTRVKGASERVSATCPACS